MKFKTGDVVVRKILTNPKRFIVRDTALDEYGNQMLVMEGYSELGWVFGDIFVLADATVGVA